MTGLVFLFVCIVGIVNGDFCSSSSHCTQCLLRADTSGRQCVWCMDSYNINAVGCFSPSSPVNGCPIGTRQQLTCRTPTDNCESATDCSTCVSRAIATDENTYKKPCNWCYSYSFFDQRVALSSGCRSTNCPNYAAFSANGCPSNSSFQNTPLIAVVLGSISLVVGLIVGAIVFCIVHSKSHNTQVRAASLLYGLSFPLWGCALFSIIISMRLAKTKHCACSGPCSWIYVLGIMELLGVLAGFLTGIVIDSIYIDNVQWNFTYYVSFTLLIGMPTVLGSLLAFGLPRIIVLNCCAKPNKVHNDDDLEHSETQPLTHNAGQYAPLPNSVIVNNNGQRSVFTTGNGQPI